MDIEEKSRTQLATLQADTLPVSVLKLLKWTPAMFDCLAGQAGEEGAEWHRVAK